MLISCHVINYFYIKGYGNVAPLSEAGKIFCIIYATIGIPLTLVLISAVVERLLIPTNWILGKLNSKLGHLYQPFNIRLLHLAIIGWYFFRHIVTKHITLELIFSLYFRCDILCFAYDNIFIFGA